MSRTLAAIGLVLALLVTLPNAALSREKKGDYPKDDVQGSLNLESAVTRGLTANPSILAARADLTGARYGRYSAAGSFGPSATLNYGWTHTQSPSPTIAGSQVVTPDKDLWTLDLNVHQPLFTGFNLLSTYQKAQLAEEQNNEQLKQAELSLILAVQKAFLSLLRARMDVKSDDDSVARLKSSLEVNQAFYEVGLKPRFDVLQAEVELATAEQQLLISRNNVDKDTVRLNTYLDLPVEAEVEYVGELTQLPFSKSLSDCLKLAYKNRPDLRIGRKSVEMAQKDSRITASGFYPQVSADYDYVNNGHGPMVDGSPKMTNDMADYWTFGVNMNWNFFSWGTTYNAYRQQEETVSKIKAELANTRLNASYEVKSNLLNIKEASDRIRVAKKSVTAAKEGFRMALARYQAQVGTNTDVLDAQSRLSRAEAQLNSALADYQTALADLYVSIGQSNPGLTTN